MAYLNTDNLKESFSSSGITKQFPIKRPSKPALQMRYDKKFLGPKPSKLAKVANKTAKFINSDHPAAKTLRVAGTVANVASKLLLPF